MTLRSARVADFAVDAEYKSYKGQLMIGTLKIDLRAWKWVNKQPYRYKFLKSSERHLFEN